MLLKIAVVEDNELYAAALEKALTDEGYEVGVFHNSQAFLDSSLSDWDIISLDHSLPDMDGMDLLSKIQETEPDKPVVYLSGQEDVEVVVEAYDKGASSIHHQE